MLKNDYDAVQYLAGVIMIPKKEAEQIVEITFLAGVSKPLTERKSYDI